jgi:IS1 family transposase
MDSFSDSGTWIWTAIDPASKLIIAFHVGQRLVADAERMIRKLSYRLENMPLFVSDGLQHYKNALLKEYGMLKKDKYPHDGRYKYSNTRVPIDGLRYAPVRKTVADGRLVEVERRTIFGKVDKKDITTSMVERLNLTFRQELNRLSRKTIGASKNINHLTAHFSFYVRYYNFCRPHRAHHLGGIRYGTPAMAMGAADEVWSIRKLLFFPYRNYIN